MQFQDWVLLIGGILVLTFIGIGLGLSIRDYKRNKTSYREREDAQLLAQPETTEMHVSVIDQACRVSSVGTKMPKTVKEFLVCFQGDDDVIYNLSVPEEAYDGFAKGQSGILTLVDGELLSFVLDDKASEQL